MEITNPMVLIPLVLGPIFIIIGLIQLKFPPKKINHIYGYRTKRSMQHQKSWDFAQQYSAKEMIKGGLFFCLLAGIGTIIHLHDILSISLVLVALIGLMIYLFNRTEKAIQKRFKQ